MPSAARPPVPPTVDAPAPADCAACPLKVSEPVPPVGLEPSPATATPSCRTQRAFTSFVPVGQTASSQPTLPSARASNEIAMPVAHKVPHVPGIGRLILPPLRCELRRL
jgi:hypothetical protein